MSVVQALLPYWPVAAAVIGAAVVAKALPTVRSGMRSMVAPGANGLARNLAKFREKLKDAVADIAKLQDDCRRSMEYVTSGAKISDEQSIARFSDAVREGGRAVGKAESHRRNADETIARAVDLGLITMLDGVPVVAADRYVAPGDAAILSKACEGYQDLVGDPDVTRARTEFDRAQEKAPVSAGTQAAELWRGVSTEPLPHARQVTQDDMAELDRRAQEAVAGVTNDPKIRRILDKAATVKISSEDVRLSPTAQQRAVTAPGSDGMGDRMPAPPTPEASAVHRGTVSNHSRRARLRTPPQPSNRRSGVRR